MNVFASEPFVADDQDVALALVSNGVGDAALHEAIHAAHAPVADNDDIGRDGLCRVKKHGPEVRGHPKRGEVAARGCLAGGITRGGGGRRSAAHALLQDGEFRGADSCAAWGRDLDLAAFGSRRDGETVRVSHAVLRWPCRCGVSVVVVPAKWIQSLRPIDRTPRSFVSSFPRALSPDPSLRGHSATGVIVSA